MTTYKRRTHDTAGDLNEKRCPKEYRENVQFTLRFPSRLAQFCTNYNINLSKTAEELIEALRAKKEKEEVDQYGEFAYRTTSNSKKQLIDGKMQLKLMDVYSNPALWGDVLEHLMNEGWIKEGNNWVKREVKKE